MASRVLFAVLFAAILFAAQVSGAAERNKIIFISDLHMNVDASYSWLVDHADDLAKFISDVASRADVAEVVILGDLVDEWVAPVKNTPNTFTDVLTAGNNTAIVAALQELCANPDIKVTYVTGNHDMLSFEDENKAILAATFPGLQIVSQSPGMGAYAKNQVIWAEHGHRYTMFNAPDTWSHPGSHLPMGYFISRMAATKSVASGEVVTTPDLLDRFVKTQPKQAAGSRPKLTPPRGVFSDVFIIGVFDAIALWCEVWPWNKFTMNDTDAFLTDPRVLTVSLIYDQIYSLWPVRQNRVSQPEAVWDDLGHLSGAANLIFEMPAYLRDKYPFTPRIIVFGHTHQAAFQYHSGEVDTIYVNSGTWIDSKPMTWVEIEITDSDDGGQLYAVSLWFNGETKPRQTATLKVSSN
ncbi:MAG: metallophosphoesterase [Syntrophobacteraceae bacterium]